MHLRYVLTGKITPRVDNLITYITDSINNEDPEPRSETYSAGVIELPEQELAKNTSKRRKLNISYKRRQQSTIPTKTIT